MCFNERRFIVCWFYNVCVCMCLFFQLVKGIRYTITVELSNTQCKKSTMLRTCDFYPEAQKLKVGCLCVCVCVSCEFVIYQMCLCTRLTVYGFFFYCISVVLFVQQKCHQLPEHVTWVWLEMTPSMLMCISHVHIYVHALEWPVLFFSDFLCLSIPWWFYCGNSSPIYLCQNKQTQSLSGTVSLLYM